MIHKLTQCCSVSTHSSLSKKSTSKTERIGQHVGIWWKETSCYHDAIVTDVTDQPLIEISYESGKKEWLPTKVDEEALADCIGRRIEVTWQDGQTYYGKVLRHNNKRPLFQVCYDESGKKEWLDFEEEEVIND